MRRDLAGLPDYRACGGREPGVVSLELLDSHRSGLSGVQGREDQNTISLVGVVPGGGTEYHLAGQRRWLFGRQGGVAVPGIEKAGPAQLQPEQLRRQRLGGDGQRQTPAD